MVKKRFVIMLVAEKSVVSIHYTLKNDAGEVLDSSVGQSPLAYLHFGKRVCQGGFTHSG
jgi:FKBP-type peptidyl-prolyl cis-trans isomerase SlyD